MGKKMAEDFSKKHPNILSPYELSLHPINGFITNYADKIIVHSDYTKHNLLEKNIGRSVCKIPHYSRVENFEFSKAEAREAMGISDDEFVFGAFGFIAETKRNREIISAFKQVHKKNPKSKLIFVGHEEGPYGSEIKKLISSLNLTDSVKITGYVTLEEFNKYLCAVDVCVGLRHPYGGESSGSFARMLGMGKCCIVNDVGDFHEAEDSACYKIPPVHTFKNKKAEVDAITKAMTTLISSPNTVANIEQNAKKYAIENLALKKIAKKYVSAIETPWRNGADEYLLYEVAKSLSWDKKEMQKISKTIEYALEF